MAEIGPPGGGERPPVRNSVERVRQFVDGRGHLLERGLRDVFIKSIAEYDRLQGDLQKMGKLKRNLSPEGIRAKRDARSTEESVKFAFEVFGRFVDIYDNAESYPRVATEMAKWGAEEWLAPMFGDRPKDATPGDLEKIYETRREQWFGGVEKMMRAAQGWQMIQSVNRQIEMAGSPFGRFEATEAQKMKFVKNFYEFVPGGKGKSFEEFTEFLDDMLVPQYIPKNERKERLEAIKDEIRVTDGFSPLEIKAEKEASPDRMGGEPLFYEYMWMVASGETSRYTKALASRMKEVARKERATGNNLFVPQLVVGVANEEDVKAGRARALGDHLIVNFSELAEGDNARWAEGKLRAIEHDYAVEDEGEGAVWISMEVDLSHVLGVNSGFADYARTIGVVEKPLVRISIPVTMKEAGILAKNYADPSQQAELREAMIDGWINRHAALVMWHGFSASEDVYMTPAWAGMALSAHSEPDNRISENNLKQTELKALLSDRLCGTMINVMGSKGTGMDVGREEIYYNTAGSMERASWYVLEVQRVLGVLPGPDDNRITIDYSHSMGAQVGERLRIFLPESVRGKFHIIVATPVSTVDKRLNTFMHGNPKNILGDAVIQWRNNPNRTVAGAGRAMAAIGSMIKLDDSIIRDMIVPYDAAKTGIDGRECRAMSFTHKRIYAQEDAYIARQRANLEARKYAFAKYTIDELHEAAGVAGGGDMTVLVGMLDEVLSSDIQMRDYGKHPNFFEMVDLTGNNWEQIMDSREKISRHIRDHHSQVLVGNFAHYLNVNKTGRKVVRKLLKNIVSRTRRGGESRPATQEPSHIFR